MMDRKRRIIAAFMAIIMSVAALFTGCTEKTPTPVVDNNNNNQQTSIDYPMVVFGEETVTNGITYKLDGEDELKSGQMFNREYVKLDKDMTLSFKIDDEFSKKLSGKNLFLRFEYFETGKKSFVVSYEGKDGEKTETVEMIGSSNWGGISIKAQAVKLDAEAKAHFTVKLDTASALWLRSVSVIEDTTKEQTYPQLIKTDYESSNGQVIQLNVKDFGAVGDGKVDDSFAFHTALRSLEGKGGTLYVPAGTYKLTQDMTVPSGVTVLGDFNKPTLENPKVSGTVLASYVPTIADGDSSVFMMMSPGSRATGLTVWYPEQTLASGEAEPYNFTFGINGPNSVTIEDIYLVNSYNGITHATYDRGHQQQMVKNIYGTPLKLGHETAKANDSDRQQGFYFSPNYWLGSGLANVPNVNVLKTWLINYAVGLNVGDIDFHFISDVTIDGYKIGMQMRKMYGRIYNLNITNCNVCLYVERPVLYGGQLTKAVLKADGGTNPIALLVGEGEEGDVNGFSATMLEISSTGKYAVRHIGAGAMTISDSKISVTGKDSVAPLFVEKGRVAIMNTTFEGGEKHAIFASGAGKSSLTNCTTSAGKLNVDNKIKNMLAIESNNANVAPMAADALDEADAKRAYQKKGPAKLELYNVADYDIPEGDKPEISVALQKAIDAAYKNGGGLVYLPAGIYRLEKSVTVKSGVELAGLTDYFHTVRDYIPTSLILTNYGKGKKQPLIKLEADSGVRGLSIIYDKVTQETITAYAPTVQATGKNCYTINMSIIGAWDAVDYNSYKCDNSYIENVNFFAFNKGIAVGGGSKGGVLINGHTNPGSMSSTGYTAYKWDSSATGPLVKYLHANATFFYFGKCTDQVTFMSLGYGANKGYMFDGAEVTSIGVGVDKSVNCIYITGKSNVNIFDPQCIAADTRQAYTSTAVVCDKDFTGTANIYNMCTWSINDASMRIDGGTFSINGGFLLHTGRSPIIATGGKVTMRGVIVKNRSIGDIQASSGVKSITAYGNIIYGTPTYLVDSAVKTYGSAFAK